MHLLERMLAFDPVRRVSAEEALAHEYFAPLESVQLDAPGASSGSCSSLLKDQRAVCL